MSMYAAMSAMESSTNAMWTQQALTAKNSADKAMVDGSSQRNAQNADTQKNVMNAHKDAVNGIKI